MAILEKLKKIIPQLENDGSREVVQQYREMIEHEGLMAELRQSEGFKRILESLRKDFKEKVLSLVTSDPELREMYKMFIRVIGPEGTSDQIENMVDELIENPKGE